MGNSINEHTDRLRKQTVSLQRFAQFNSDCGNSEQLPKYYCVSRVVYCFHRFTLA